jgi:hypothetical protein
LATDHYQEKKPMKRFVWMLALLLLVGCAPNDSGTSPGAPNGDDASTIDTNTTTHTDHADSSVPT